MEIRSVRDAGREANSAGLKVGDPPPITGIVFNESTPIVVVEYTNDRGRP